MNDAKAKELLGEMTTKFPMTQWGRIEWDIIANKLVEIGERSVLLPGYIYDSRMRRFKHGVCSL